MSTINIQGVLLILTLIRYTQTVEKPLQYNFKNKPNVTATDNNKKSNNTQKKQWTFQDFVKKFEPATIWEQIDKQKKYNGLVLSDEEQAELMYKAMDPTDEIMSYKVENGDVKIVFQKEDLDGRRGGWRPNMNGYIYNPGDYFQLRHRFYQLMKQVIYQARNRMVPMQILREKYRNSSLYKMGMMMNKADNAAKTFGKFSFRAMQGCLWARGNVIVRMTAFDLISANERQLFLWFNLEILVDLIKKNDNLCREIFANRTKGRVEEFDKRIID